jgi:iron complex outermembrane receptor protein
MMQSHKLFFGVNMADFASSVEEVQIQRGVGTSTNGAASFGASVNFQTVDLQEKPHAQISSSVGHLVLLNKQCLQVPVY